MIQLNSGNVLLKPSHRKHLMAALRRAQKLGDRLGHFVLNLSLQRQGKSFDVRAHVHDSAGEFKCHARNHDWRMAIRDLVRSLVLRLQSQLMLRAATV